MATFYQHIKHSFNTKSYEETKLTCDWIIESIGQLNLPDVTFTTDINVNIGDITCSCTNIKEFSEICYGEPNFSLLNFILCFYSNNKLICSVQYMTDLTVSTNNKQQLEQIVHSLVKTAQKNKNNKSVPANIIYNAPVINGNNNGTFINSDNNVSIVNGNENYTAGAHTIPTLAKTKKATSKGSERFRSILDNLTANWIWIILLLIISIIISYFGLH